MSYTTSNEMIKKAERIQFLANTIEDLESRLSWYCDKDENGNIIPPKEEEEYNYMRYNLLLEVIKAVSKLA